MHPTQSLTAQKIANYEVHPAAALFPMMPDNELAELAADIKAHGLLMNVVIYQGQIIDGRNRALACELAGVTMRTAILELPEDMLPTEWVLSVNRNRRHLTPSQRAAIAVAALPLLEEEAKKRMVEAGKGVAIVPHLTGKSREKAASATGASPRYVQDAKTIQEKAPEVFEQVKRGEKTIPEANREINHGLKKFDFGKRLENYSAKGIELLEQCQDVTDVESLEEELKGLLEKIHDKYLEFKHPITKAA
jgi:hypothetical protein